MINSKIFSKLRMRINQNSKFILLSFLFLFSTQFIFAYERNDSIVACVGSTINVDGIDYTLREDTTFQYTILGQDFSPDRLGQEVNRILAQQLVEDTIVYLSVDVLPLETKTIDTAICAGSTINIDGVDYTPAADTAVEYVITGENGDCDTNATVNITIRTLETKTIDTAICAGSTINIDGVDYTPAADTAVEYVITGENGDCDTNATVNITIRTLETKTIDTAICAGSTINIDGVDYTPAADTAVEYVITGENGDCDTNATVNIIIRALESKTIDTAICAGSTINIDGVDYTPAADTAVEYVITGENGDCDTNATVNIIIRALESKTIDTAICAGSTINIDGVDYTPAADTAVGYVITGENGDCDTNATVNIIIRALESKTIDTAICAGSTINIDGVDYTPAADTAVEYVITGENGDCDTNATVNIIIRALESKTIDTAICAGSTINIDGVDYTPAADTAVEYVITGENGDCDTNATVNITIRALETLLVDTTNNIGEVITINGVDYSPISDTSVIYILPALVSEDCDTVVTVNIDAILLPPSVVIADTIICKGAKTSVTASGIPNAQMTWYADSMLNNPIQLGSLLITPFLDSSITYYVTQTVYGLTSEPAVAIITVQDYSLEPVLAIPVGLICQSTDAIVTSSSAATIFYSDAGFTVLGTGSELILDSIQSSIVIYAKDTTNAMCPSKIVSVKINVEPKLSKPNVSNTVICSGRTATLTGASAITHWYDDSLLTNEINLGASYTTPILEDTAIYYLRNEEVDKCASDVTVVTVVVNKRPEKPIVGEASTCYGQFATIVVQGENVKWFSDSALTNLVFFGTTLNTPILYRDTVYFVTQTQNNCQSDSSTVHVKVFTKPDRPIINSIPVICVGTELNLTVLNEQADQVYNWVGPNNFTSNVTNPTIENVTLAAAGTYTVYASLGNCKSDIATTIVYVNQNPTADAGADVTIFQNQSITLQGSGGQIYSWTPDDNLSTNNISNPIFMSEEIGVYEIELTVWDGGFGCLDKDTVVITVVPVEKLIIPDIITPNGDNVNDEWVIQYLENVGSPYTLSVYARGGAMVMNTTSYNQQWRGTYNDKELHDGAYWYVLEFENGIIYKGTLTIKR
jgi:gliding motility-associated-like protein